MTFKYTQLHKYIYTQISAQVINKLFVNLTNIVQLHYKNQNKELVCT